MNSKVLTSVIIVVLALGYWYIQAYPINLQTVTQPTIQPAVTSVQIAIRVKSSGCQITGALQDIGCTPGAFDANLSKDVLCSATFTTKSVRNVPTSEKDQVYQEYGIPSHKPGQYEVDHLISLELGGSNDIANLWPEAAEPRPGFHEKDVIENYLHKQVCNGSISLQDAQREISSNWLQIYQSVPGIKTN